MEMETLIAVVSAIAAVAACILTYLMVQDYNNFKTYILKYTKQLQEDRSQLAKSKANVEFGPIVVNPKSASLCSDIVWSEAAGAFSSPKDTKIDSKQQQMDIHQIRGVSPKEYTDPDAFEYAEAKHDEASNGAVGLITSKVPSSPKSVQKTTPFNPYSQG